MPLSDPFSSGRLRTVNSTLSALTGVRSGKNSYYREMRRTEERMTSAVRTLEVISSAQVLTRDDPRGLLHEVLRAAADHLGSDWTMIALRGAVAGLHQRFVALGPLGRVVTNELTLPAPMLAELRCADRELVTDTDAADGWVRVPMTLDGQVLGALVASQPASGTIEHEDRWVLRILVNQAALALHTASMLSEAAEMRTKAQELYDEIARSSKDLQTRTAQLEQAEDRLRLLHQRELLDAERHRIAAELHDSVAQYVLSAGFAVDVCRAEAAERAKGDGTDETVERLTTARNLIATAGDQVRSSIYALHHEPAGGESASLAQLLGGLAAQHRHDLEVAVRIDGRPVTLSPEIVRALARICGEALFNVVSHAKAGRASIRLRYTSARVSLSICDDGPGEPRELRRLLRLEQAGDADGRHQGLAGMARRAAGIGARFSISKAAMGGIRIGIVLPLTDTTGGQ